MAIRPSIVFATLAAMVCACFAVSESSVTTLRSKRRSASISVTAPTGFNGPAYNAWPSYDEFSFAQGTEPEACYLQVRFDPYTDEPGDRHSAEDLVVHWNRTPLAKIQEPYKRGFQNPQVERIATVRLAGETVRVYAVYNTDGYFYAAETRRADTVISFELRSPSRRELERHKASFLSLLRSLGIT
jgi:hypothetical protein